MKVGQQVDPWRFRLRFRAEERISKDVQTLMQVFKWQKQLSSNDSRGLMAKGSSPWPLGMSEVTGWGRETL